MITETRKIVKYRCNELWAEYCGRKQPGCTGLWYYASMENNEQHTGLSEREALERDTDVGFFVAGGPGGQHRNKVETGVRLLHRPTGIVVTASERRSQAANREAAFERLAERLAALQVRRKPRHATRPTAASRVRRAEAKRQRSLTKQGRRPVREE